MARKSKYTPETIEKLLHAIELGATYELACGYAGIGWDTFNTWRETKPDFSEQLRAAEGQASLKWLEKIEQAGTEDWRAMAWKLERRYPRDYGKSVVENQHTGKDGGPLEFTGIDVPRPKATE